jgi:hypothetical protein
MEAFNVTQRLDSGDAQGAADELAMDLYQMKGDRYAQDELLSEINSDDVKMVGADLRLDNWDPDRGTWDDIEIVPNDGSDSIPVTAYDYDDPPPYDQVQSPPTDTDRDQDRSVDPSRDEDRSVDPDTIPDPLVDDSNQR